MEESINGSPLQFLKLQAKGIIRYARVSEIVYFKAQDNYTMIMLNDQSKFIICKTLKSFELKIGKLFFRCHKTYLVNTLYVKGINKKSRAVILKTGQELPYSRSLCGLTAIRLEKSILNTIHPVFNTVYPVSDTIQ